MKTLAAVAFLATLFWSRAHAQINAGERKPEANLPFAMTQVTTLNLPWRIAFLPDGRMLITEKVGPLWLVTQKGEKTRVANVPAVLYGGQGGMLGVFTSPRYATDHNVYLTYSEPGDGGSSLALARARPLRVGRQSEPRRARGALASDAEGQRRAVRRADRVLAGRAVSIPHGRRPAAHDAGAGSRSRARQDPAPHARRQARARQSGRRQDRCDERDADRSAERHRGREDRADRGPLLSSRGRTSRRRKFGRAATERRTASRSRPTAGSGSSSTARAAATSST